MKSTTAQQIIDNDAVTMNNGDRMVDASTAYQAAELAEQEAEEQAAEAFKDYMTQKHGGYLSSDLDYFLQKLNEK